MADETSPPDPPTAVLAWAGTGVGRALMELPARWFHATLEGTEHVPQVGGALFVGNHALLGLDGVVLQSLVFRSTGRWIRFLGERNLWRIPVFSQVLDMFGAHPGAPDTAVKLLREGHVVGVYPGGVDDSFKSKEERYRLKWGNRAGFAKVAIRAGVPILPVAALGIDEMYEIVGRERWIGRTLLGSPRYDIPIAYGAYGTPLPRRVPQRYVVLPPIDTGGDPDDPKDVERVRAATFEAIQGRLDQGR